MIRRTSALIITVMLATTLASAHALAEGRQATVHAVWFSGDKGKTARGGTSLVEIRVQKNNRALPSVGVLEQYPGATGGKWQTSAWLAAFNASQALGQSLTANEFTVKAFGNIDGPSAGMLLTSTMMALMTRTPLLRNSTMTGTVNPDGSAGPVGGIVQKMMGAKRAGITRFGYPYGKRFTEDRRNGRTVDLHQLGRALGMFVQPITNLHEAYTFMTGKTILRPLPARAGVMKVSGKLQKQVQSALGRWKSRYTMERLMFLPARKALGAKMRAEIEPLWAKARSGAADGARFEKAGDIAAAYDAYTSATAALKMAARLIPFVKAAKAKKYKSLLKQVKGLAKVGEKLPKLGRSMDMQGLFLSVAERVAGAAAMQPFIGATAFRKLGVVTLANAEKMLGDAKADDKKKKAAVAGLARCLAYFTKMGELMEIARDDLSFRSPSLATSRILTSSRSEATLGAAYASAARAAMEHFDSLFIAPQAKQHKVAKMLIQEIFTTNDPLYAVGWHAANIAANVSGGGAAALLRLAAGSYAYTGAAHLMDRYYVLQYRPKPDGSVQVRNPAVLASQLTEARARALEASGAAENALGFVPGPAQIAFSIAQAREKGSDREKVDALRQYRLCTFWARTALNIKA